MKITQTQIRCLLALLALSRQSEDIASKDVARLLGVSRPSVHKALDLLCREGLVEKYPYGAVHLSPAGADLARRLARRGAGTLVLLSRRGATPDTVSALRELRYLGLPEGRERLVLALAQDVTDAEGLAAALDTALEGIPPLRGIIHAAAVLEDVTLTGLTPQALERVLRPKLAGALALHQYSLDKKLDFFIMYSSEDIPFLPDGSDSSGSFTAVTAPQLESPMQTIKMIKRPHSIYFFVFCFFDRFFISKISPYTPDRAW